MSGLRPGTLDGEENTERIWVILDWRQEFPFILQVWPDPDQMNTSFTTLADFFFIVFEDTQTNRQTGRQLDTLVLSDTHMDGCSVSLLCGSRED